MNLFDDKERNDTGQIETRESHFAFLNRSAHPKCVYTRSLLEGWMQEYPDAHQKAIWASFRSDRDIQHWGAFFELYCHALLRHLGFTTSVQVVVDEAVNRPIDFLVQENDTPLFYLESTVATGSSAVFMNQRKIRELIDALNVLHNPDIQVSIGIRQESSHNLPLSQICTAVHQWLQTLDPDQVLEQKRTTTYGKHPQYSWERDGWKISFLAIPRSKEERGTKGQTVLYHGWTARRVEVQKSLKEAFDEKANRYGKLHLPYVIAVDVLAIDSFGSNIGEVLFGKEVVLIDTQSEKTTLTRSPLLPNRPRSENGLWFDRRGQRNQQISAVLLVNDLLPWEIAHKTPVLWHNPWAEKPLDPGLWQGPQMLPDMNASPPYMQYREGKQGDEIFRLPPDWPDISVQNNI
jgi:hypothetical protein